MELSLGMIFLTAFLVCLSGAMVPGPLFTVTVGEAARRGFIAGPLVVMGHALLELALIIALVKGFSDYLARPRTGAVIALLGGGMLIYLGYAMIKDARTQGAALNNAGNPVSGRGRSPAWQPAVTGVVASISNPYWLLWWATVGLGYITLALKKGMAGIIAFFSGHVLGDLLWFTLVAAAVAGGRRFLSAAAYRWIFVFCGVFLIGLGGYFGVSAVSFIGR